MWSGNVYFWDREMGWESRELGRACRNPLWWVRAKWLEDMLVSFPAEKPKGPRGKGGMSSTPWSYATTRQRCLLSQCRPRKGTLKPRALITLKLQVLRLLLPPLTSLPSNMLTLADTLRIGRDPRRPSSCITPSMMGLPLFSILLSGTAFSPNNSALGNFRARKKP